MIKYDDQTLEDQIAVNKAMMGFLEASNYENLVDACQKLGQSPQDLWSEILSDAELPPCLPPVAIQVAGPLARPPARH